MKWWMKRKSDSQKIAFYLLTFSLSDMKELELGIEDIPEGLLEDFLLASAYLLGFKNEELHGKKYMDGGVINNVPLGTLVERGYQNIIEVRIFGPGREPRVYLPDDVTVYEIAPRVKLGSIIEFQEKRSRQNMKMDMYMLNSGNVYDFTLNELQNYESYLKTSAGYKGKVTLYAKISCKYIYYCTEKEAQSIAQINICQRQLFDLD